MTGRPPPGPESRPLTRLEKVLLIVTGGLGGFLLVAVVTAGLPGGGWLPGWVFRFGAIPVVACGGIFVWLRQRGGPR